MMNLVPSLSLVSTFITRSACVALIALSYLYPTEVLYLPSLHSTPALHQFAPGLPGRTGEYAEKKVMVSFSSIVLSVMDNKYSFCLVKMRL